MELHSWTQDVYLGAGRLDGLSYVTEIQRYKCRNCDETLSLPDCRKKTCLILMSLGCTRTIAKVKWQAPIKERDNEVKKPDYPAKKKTRR